MSYLTVLRSHDRKVAIKLLLVVIVLLASERWLRAVLVVSVKTFLYLGAS